MPAKHRRHHHAQSERPLLRSGLAAAVSLVQFVYATVLLAAAVVRIAGSGIFSYIQHFTNWAWTVEFLFYYLTFAGPLIVARRDRGWLRALTLGSIAALLPIVWGVAWVVATLVVTLLLTGSPFLSNLLTTYPLAELVVGDIFLHFVPVVAAIFYVMINYRLVFGAFNRLLTRQASRRHAFIRFWLIIYLAGGGVMILALFYLALFDPRQVYSTNISLPVGVAFIVVVLIVSNLAPIVAAIAVLGVATYRYSDDWMEHLEFGWNNEFFE